MRSEAQYAFASRCAFSSCSRSLNEPTTVILVRTGEAKCVRMTPISILAEPAHCKISLSPDLRLLQFRCQENTPEVCFLKGAMGASRPLLRPLKVGCVRHVVSNHRRFGPAWADTPLGPVSVWPQSLRAVVNILLTSRYPMWVG